MRSLMFLMVILLASCSNAPDNLALGTLERARIAHTATASEVVVSLPVLQGSMVQKGTILVKLDDTLQQSQVNKAKAEVARVEAYLEKLRRGARVEEMAIARAKVAESKAAYVESDDNYNRSLTLMKQKVISKAILDKDRASRDTRLASMHRSEEELNQLSSGTREEDLRATEAHLVSVLATLSSEQKKLSNLTVRATRDGILDNLPWNLGERVTIGSPLAIILAGKAPFARIYVPEIYRVKLKVGDSLVVHVDGIKQAIKGQLRWIASEPAFTPYYALNQQERSRLMYLAEVQLPDSDAYLPNGVPAQVELP